MSTLIRLPIRKTPALKTFFVILGAIALGFGVGIGVVLAQNPLYIVFALLGVGVGILMLINIQIGLLSIIGVITLLPYAVVPVPLGTFKLTALDISLSVTLLVWLARLLTQRDTRFVTTGLEAFFGLFIALCVFSFLNGTSTSSETMRLFLKMINSIILFFTIVNCVRTLAEIRLVVRAIILGAAGSAIIGIALYFLPKALSSQILNALAPLNYPTGNVLRYIASTDTLRAISTSVDPNVFGAMLLIALALAFGQFVTQKPALGRPLLIAIGLVISFALLLSYSRGSFIGAIVGLAVVAVLGYRRTWLLVVLAFGGLLFLAAPMLGDVPLIGSFLAHLSSGFEAKDQAAAMRLGEYKDAFKLISQYPFFGVGFGVAPDIDLYIGVSSIYLLLAEQVGLVGLSAYLLLVGMVLWRALRTILRFGLMTEESGHLLGALGAICGALTAGLADHHFVNLRFPHLVALFWLIAALVIISERLVRERVASPESKIQEAEPIKA